MAVGEYVSINGVESEGLNWKEKIADSTGTGSAQKLEELNKAGIDGNLAAEMAELQVIVLKEVQAVKAVDPDFFDQLNAANPNVAMAFTQTAMAFPGQAEAFMDMLEHDQSMRDQLLKATQSENFPKDLEGARGMIGSWLAENKDTGRTDYAAIKDTAVTAIDAFAEDVNRAEAEKQKEQDRIQAEQKAAQLKAQNASAAEIAKAEAEAARLKAEQDRIQADQDARNQQVALQAKEAEAAGLNQRQFADNQMAGMMAFLPPEFLEGLMDFLKPLLDQLGGMFSDLAEKHPDSFFGKNLDQVNDAISAAKGALDDVVDNAKDGAEIAASEITVKIGDQVYKVDIDQDTGNENVLADFRKELGDDFGPDNNQAIVLDSSNIANSPVLEQLQMLNPNIQVMQIGADGGISSKVPLSELTSKMENPGNQEIEVTKDKNFDNPNMEFDISGLIK